MLQPPLYAAAENGHAAVVDVLMKAGADANIVVNIKVRGDTDRNYNTIYTLKGRVQLQQKIPCVIFLH